MKLIGFIFRHIIPIGLIAVIGLVIMSIAKPVQSSRIDGIGVDLLSSPALTQDVVDTQLNLIQKSGSKFIRVEMNWTLIETAQDTYDWSNVMPLDLLFNAAQSRGFKSVAVITGFPLYLSSYGSSLDQKIVGERWEKFIQAAVDHFGDQINFWQIGDQINSNISSRSLAQADPDFYANMLRSASKIIKNKEASDEVWMGSLVSASSAVCVMNPLTFILEVNGAKAWSAADAITFQPQRGSAAPENPSNADNNQGCVSNISGNSASISSEVQTVQDLARQLGGKPVYITGLTWNQNDLIALQNNRTVDLNTLQSDLLVRGSIMLMSGNSIPLVFWQIDPVSQAPAMNSLSNLNNLISNSQSLGQIQGQSGIVQEYRFQNGASIYSIAWRSADGDAAQPVNFSGLTAGSMTAYAVDTSSLQSDSGTPIEVDGSGNTRVMLNERPVLFIGKMGGWDVQMKAGISNQVDLWRIELQRSLSNWLLDRKEAFLQWMGQLFIKAKDTAVDWGEDQIQNILK